MNVDDVDTARLSPWDEQRVLKLAAGDPTGGFGPGTLADFVLLSGQSDDEVDPREVIDAFIRRNCPRNVQPHLLDDDDNDGEYLRREVAKLIAAAEARGAARVKRRLRKLLDL